METRLPLVRSHVLRLAVRGCQDFRFLAHWALQSTTLKQKELSLEWKKPPALLSTHLMKTSFRDDLNS